MISVPESKDGMSLRVLAHVHTRRSRDAWISPSQIVNFAVQAHLGLVIVTDHDSHLGSVDCQAASPPGGPCFPMAAEYRSTEGDIIAAFLSTPILTRDVLGIIEEAHAQGGLTILPHPYKSSRFRDTVFERADIIEVFNARCSDEENARASETAISLGKPAIAGPDAHFVDELGLAINEIQSEPGAELMEQLLRGRCEYLASKTTKRLIRQSQMLRALRCAQPLAFGKNLIRWLQAGTHDTP